jgi:hypothetical protein
MCKVLQIKKGAVYLNKKTDTQSTIIECGVRWCKFRDGTKATRKQLSNNKMFEYIGHIDIACNEVE